MYTAGDSPLEEILRPDCKNWWRNKTSDRIHKIFISKEEFCHLIIKQLIENNWKNNENL